MFFSFTDFYGKGIKTSPSKGNKKGFKKLASWKPHCTSIPNPEFGS